MTTKVNWTYDLAHVSFVLLVTTQQQQSSRKQEQKKKLNNPLVDKLIGFKVMNETSRETTITVEIVSATPNDDVAMSRHPPPRAAAAAPICIVCGHHAPDVRKLKTHLLLKHPNIHLCLFCVEKKGWSDDFASQAQYNQVRSLLFIWKLLQSSASLALPRAPRRLHRQLGKASGGTARRQT